MTKEKAYELLELDRNSSSHEIETAYRKLYNEYQIRITNAPTASQRTKFQERLSELDQAYEALKGDSSENIQSELPSLQPLAGSPKEEPKVELKRELTRESALKILGLNDGFSIKEIEQAFEKNRVQAEESIKGAFNDDVRMAYRESLLELETAYNLLKKDQPKKAEPKQKARSKKKVNTKTWKDNSILARWNQLNKKTKLIASIGFGFVLIVSLFLLFYKTQETKDWELAYETATRNSFESYIEKYPEGKYLANAQDSLRAVSWRWKFKLDDGELGPVFGVQTSGGGVIFLYVVLEEDNVICTTNVVRLDQYGDELWRKEISTNSFYGERILPLSNGNYLVIGDVLEEGADDRIVDAACHEISLDGEIVRSIESGMDEMSESFDDAVEIGGEIFLVGQHGVSYDRDILLYHIKGNEIVWEKQFGSEDHVDYSSKLLRNGDEHLMVFGKNVVKVDDELMWNILMIKTDLKGEEVWSNRDENYQLGFYDDVEINDIKLIEGNYYLVAGINSKEFFGDSYYHDYIVVFDKDGNVLWDRMIKDSIGYSLEIYPGASGDFYTTSLYASRDDSSGGSQVADFVLNNYSLDGELISTRSLGAKEEYFANSILLPKNRLISFGGNFNNELIVVKIDADGELSAVPGNGLKILSPSDNEVLYDKDDLKISWENTGAHHYEVIIDYWEDGDWQEWKSINTRKTVINPGFYWGAERGRVRVTEVSKTDVKGKSSEWISFEYD